jgi:hypothetical protein
MDVVFLPQIGETTLLFEGLQVEVLAACYAITREALSPTGGKALDYFGKFGVSFLVLC